MASPTMTQQLSKTQYQTLSWFEVFEWSIPWGPEPPRYPNDARYQDMVRIGSDFRKAMAGFDQTRQEAFPQEKHDPSHDAKTCPTI